MSQHHLEVQLQGPCGLVQQRNKSILGLLKISSSFEPLLEHPLPCSILSSLFPGITFWYTALGDYTGVRRMDKIDTLTKKQRAYFCLWTYPK